MNFKKFLCAALFLIPANLLCWDAQEVQISKGNKSVSFMIRYFSEHEKDAFTQAMNEGFQFLGNHVGMKIDKENLSVCGLARHYYAAQSDVLYASLKQILNSPKSDSFNDLYYEHNQWLGCGQKFPKIDKQFNKSTVILLASNKEQHLFAQAIDSYRVAMKKVAAEDSKVTFKEINYKNGKPVTNLWNRFKNFVWNEKFLYAMSALSALYLGYEYLKQ